MIKGFAAFGLLACLGICFEGQAQQIPINQHEISPFFIGSSGYQSNYEVFFSPNPIDNSTASTGPWQLNVGVALSFRLECQIGYSYRHEHEFMDPFYSGTNSSGQTVSGASINDFWTHCIPVLARYTVLHCSKNRFRIDGLLGFTILNAREFSAVENRVNSLVISSLATDYQATQLYASFGFGGRYSFGQHFEGILDWTYSRNFRQASPDVHFQATGNEYGLTRALSLGFRYRFAMKKKAVATAP
jgi:hypothetical protein